MDKNTSIINYISEKISISYYVLVDLESRELQDFTSREIACLSRRSSSSLQYKRNQVLDTCDTLSQTCLFLGANNEPSKDQQGEFSAMLHTNHHWQINSPKDLKEQVATELGPWVRILQEQYPGACAQAMCQKEAQSDRRPRPRQLDDGTLADANKAEAAPIESWTLGMSS